MANLGPDHGRSILLGSSGMIYTDQMAVDIYFDNIWNAVGEVSRLAVVCVAWGMSIAVVQSANAPAAGRPGPWHIQHGLLHDIVVQDHGLHPLHPPGHLPNVPAGQPLPPLGMYVVGGMATTGHHVPWHHRVEIRRAPQNNGPLHYHQHHRRKNHLIVPPPIKPAAIGKHRVFNTITYSTQIQNYRRIKETGENAQADEED